jgi:hypothetical protein
MRYEKITYTVRYPVFDKGERVVIRDTGESGVVERFHAPSHPEDDAIVFLEGRRTGISAGKCDPYHNPALPVIRTMEHAEDEVAVWVETPDGRQILYDERGDWEIMQAGRRPGYFPTDAAAVHAATSHAATLGFPATQHHPL